MCNTIKSLKPWKIKFNRKCFNLKNVAVHVHVAKQLRNNYYTIDDIGGIPEVGQAKHRI